MNPERPYFHYITFVNILLVAGMLFRVCVINSDKGILILIFYFPALIILNGIMWGITEAFKRKLAKVFRFNLLLLAALLIPVIVFGITL
jgi:hypothetical protein